MNTILAKKKAFGIFIPTPSRIRLFIIMLPLSLFISCLYPLRLRPASIKYRASPPPFNLCSYYFDHKAFKTCFFSLYERDGTLVFSIIYFFFLVIICSFIIKEYNTCLCCSHGIKKRQRKWFCLHSNNVFKQVVVLLAKNC